MSPSSSEAQRKLACIALSIKLGKTKASYSPQAAEMAKSMSVAQLKEFCREVKK